MSFKTNTDELGLVQCFLHLPVLSLSQRHWTVSLTLSLFLPQALTRLTQQQVGIMNR